MTRNKLGRGLASLLKTDAADQPAGDLAYIPITQIEPNPYQPRRDLDEAELSGLLDSIREHGVIQPILVRRSGEAFQLVAGERRWRASMQAGLDVLPAKVVEVDDQEMVELAIIENLQREDLNAIDKAEAFRSHLDRFGLTQEAFAGRIGLDRATVANFVRLLELPEPVQALVRGRQLSMGHARALLAVSDPTRQVELARRVAGEGLSVRQVERLVVDQAQPEPGKKPPRPSRKSAHIENLELQLKKHLGTPVTIRLSRRSGQGQILIDFRSNDEFERIYKQLT